jgi:hypothetical protein
MALKGVILTLGNVIYHNNQLDPDAFAEMGRFVKLLVRRGVTPVVIANHTRRMDSGGTLQAVVDRAWAEFDWFVAEEGTGGWKPRPEAVERVLAQKGWNPEEVALVGNSKSDMLSAKHGKVLFLNAEWFTPGVNYGLKFASIREIGRFVDLFCLREHFWHFMIDTPSLHVYALSPYSTFKEEFATYSEDARESLKRGGRHIDFWTKYLCSSIYFTGVNRGISYVAPYPGHLAGAGSPLLDDLLFQVATCFGVSYLPDLIIRHTDAPKSQYDRAGADHLRQLNTIRLNRTPLRYGATAFKNPPLRRGKRVLVVDDFCTEGKSFEAARLYIEQTGAEAVNVAFLKTINRSYDQLVDVARFNPYTANAFAGPLGRHSYHDYLGHIVDRAAPAELDDALARFDGWTWPPE